MRDLLLTLLVSTLVSGVLLPTSANADATIYGLPLDPDASGQFSNYDPAGSSRQIVAQRFTPVEDAGADKLRWWGVFQAGLVFPDASFRVRLYSGISSPAEVVYETVVVPTQVDTGLLNGDRPVIEFSADGLPLILLEVNETRWIEIACDNSRFIWLASTSFTHFVAVRALEDEPWIVRPASIPDHAFQLLLSQGVPTESRTMGQLKLGY